MVSETTYNKGKRSTRRPHRGEKEPQTGNIRGPKKTKSAVTKPKKKIIGKLKGGRRKAKISLRKPRAGIIVRNINSYIGISPEKGEKVWVNDLQGTSGERKIAKSQRSCFPGKRGDGDPKGKRRKKYQQAGPPAPPPLGKRAS